MYLKVYIELKSYVQPCQKKKKARKVLNGYNFDRSSSAESGAQNNRFDIYNCNAQL